MAYTVNHLYKKVLEGADKMGSDFFTAEYVMNRLETATFDFIGETVKYIENTQEIRDDIRTLYEPFKIATISDPNDNEYMSIALPKNYQHMMEAKVLDANVHVRKTRTIRHGQEEIFETDPDTKATAEYPTIVMYQDIARILSDGTPTFVYGFYVMKPTFGKYGVHDDLDSEIAVNLPDQGTDKIIKIIINDIFIATGDPRAQAQYLSANTFRKRGQ